jgi:hypothetical protein
VPRLREGWTDVPGVKVARPQDWKDVQAYEELVRLSASPIDPKEVEKRWAWEFLRRSPAYQRAYLAWRQLPTLRLQRSEMLASPFGLDWIIPPIEAEPTVIPFRNTFALRMFDGEHLPPRIGNLRLREAIPEPLIAVLFNRHLPLAFQLELAEAQLSEAISAVDDTVPKPPRKEEKHFRLYLRLLDAKARGVRNEAIAGQLIREGRYKGSSYPRDSPKRKYKYFAGEGALEKDLRQAKALRDGRILLLPYGKTEVAPQI